MISIIICSRTPQLSQVLYQNIEETIGCAHELIVIDNSENKYSIFRAYNLGIQKSKGDFWCFMHDDILLHTKNWGFELLKIFNNDSKIGLIGVAGAKMKTKMPSAWWDCPEDQKVINIKQHMKNNTIQDWRQGWSDNSIEQVAVIDGVFMVAKRDINIIFDTKLKGFHNYDLSLSLLYQQNKYKVVVTQNILLEHFSLGIINKEWFQSSLQFDALFKSSLPIIIEKSLSDRQFKVQEFKNGVQFCINLVNNDLKIKAIPYWIRLFFIKPISKFHYIFLKLLLK